MRPTARLIAIALAASAATPARAQFDDESHDRQKAELERMRDRASGSQRTTSRYGAAPPRHEGFYFRADTGYGYMNATDPSGSGSSYTGTAALGAYHVGGSIQGSALLGVQLWAALMQNPTYKYALGTDRMSGTVGNLGLGPELTLYLLPSNVYVSSAVGLTWFLLSSSSNSQTSKTGLGARVTVGKEWWLSQTWGLGVAAACGFSANKLPIPQTDSSRGFQTWNLGLVASLTYN